MRCEQCREAVSARLDGEAAGTDDHRVEAHLATCGACRRFEAGAAEMHRATRVRAAEPVPDLTARVLAHAGPTRNRPQRPPAWPRYALLTVALTQLVLAVPALVLGAGTADSVHAARELGAWDAALGFGLLVAAWQPRRANGLLPMAAALAGAMALTALVDVVSGRTFALGEAHHVLDLAGLYFLWLLARVPLGPRRPTPRPALA
ncbi:MAG: zf-HC2 domain-containing protein [Acidimicrobiia bacterium]